MKPHKWHCQVETRLADNQVGNYTLTAIILVFCINASM